MVDRDGRWRGATADVALGGILDGNLTAMASRAAREAIASNQRMAYQSTDRWQRIAVVPQGSGSVSGCRQVRERVQHTSRTSWWSWYERWGTLG